MEYYDRGQPRADRSKLESQLEVMFIQALEKYLCPRSEVHPQYEVSTLIGKYRLNFVVELDGRKVGFECDGKEYHDAYRDEWRDGLILHSGEIDVIYRFRGKDIFSFIEDCIYVVYMYDPSLFNDRYQHFFDKLVSKSTIDYFLTDDFDFRSNEHSFIGIEAVNDDGKVLGLMELQTIRRAMGNEGHWKVLVKFAQENSNKGLDELIALYKDKKFI